MPLTEQQRADESGVNRPWSEWRELVLHELERHGDAIIQLNNDKNDQRVEIAVIKTKLVLLGAAGAFGVELLFRAFEWLTKR